MRTDLLTVVATILAITGSSYACGSDDPAAPPGATPGLDGSVGEPAEGGEGALAGGFEGALAALTLATCKTIYECPSTNDEVGGLRVMFSSPEDCAQRIRAYWTPRNRVWGWLARLDHLAPLAATGTLSVDQGALEACVRSVADTCASNDACDQIFVGTGASGDACRVSETCKPGLYCKPTAGNVCPGSCAPRVGIGSPCSGARGECAVGATCDNSMCTARPAVVAQRGGLDQACDGDVHADGQPLRLCEAGLFCQKGAASAPSTCRPPIAAGAPCNGRYTDVCVAGHLCLGPSGGRTCKPVTLGAAGSDCAMNMTSSDIRPCNPWTGLACLTDGKCGAAGGSEQPPLRIFDEAICLEGFSPGLDRKCHAPVATSGACSDDGQCASGACDTALSQCRDTYCD
jgi:hypothetical protein